MNDVVHPWLFDDTGSGHFDNEIPYLSITWIDICSTRSSPPLVGNYYWNRHWGRTYRSIGSISMMTSMHRCTMSPKGTFRCTMSSKRTFWCTVSSKRTSTALGSQRSSRFCVFLLVSWHLLPLPNQDCGFELAKKLAQYYLALDS